MSQDEKFGFKWRLLAHREDRSIELENEGLFDELVVDDWLHIEKMDRNVWWMRLGDACITITLSQDDRPVVDIERGFYETPNGTTSVREEN